jgi:hypothetical protein
MLVETTIVPHRAATVRECHRSFAVMLPHDRGSDVSRNSLSIARQLLFPMVKLQNQFGFDRMVNAVFFPEL